MDVHVQHVHASALVASAAHMSVKPALLTQHRR